MFLNQFWIFLENQLKQSSNHFSSRRAYTGIVQNTYDIWIPRLTASVWGNILISLGDGLLTHCDLVTAKGDIDLDQQWLR